MLLRYAAVLACVCPGISLLAADEKASGPPPEVVELFDAAESGKIQVTLIARSSKHASVQLHNPTAAPLVVCTPSVILAQPRAFFAGPDRFREDADEKKKREPQMMGLPFPQGPFNQQRQPPFDIFNRQNQGNQFPGGQFDGPNGFFSVPAGKTVRLKLTGVCLQYGRREPNTRVVYDIARFESQIDKPELRALLEGLGREKYGQTEAQIAAWHWTEGMTWRELASVNIRYMNGQERKRFTRAQIDRARRIAERLEAKVKERSNSAATLAKK